MKYPKPFITDIPSGSMLISASGGFINLPLCETGRFEDALDIEALADKLWEKIYNKPMTISCSYCSSHNAVTNPTCVQCGGPLGAK